MTSELLDSGSADNFGGPLLTAPFVSDSISPDTDYLLLVWCTCSNTAVAPSVTGLGLTWDLVSSVANLDTGGTFLFRAMGTPTPGTVTIDWAAGVARMSYAISQHGNVPTGANGANAILQVLGNQNDESENFPNPIGSTSNLTVLWAVSHSATLGSEADPTQQIDAVSPYTSLAYEVTRFSRARLSVATNTQTVAYEANSLSSHTSIAVEIGIVPAAPTLTHDYWAWVEPGGEVVEYPYYGHGVGRTQFPPRPDHPAIHFQKYDPNTPSLAAPDGTFVSRFFTDYSVWSGWNADKSATWICGLKVDIPGDGGPFPDPGPEGTDLHFVRIDTSDDTDLSLWEPDYNTAIFVPVSISSNFRDCRFIPTTEHITFLANESGVSKLFRLRTDTETFDVLATNVSKYAYSYDNAYLAIQYQSALGTRVYTRDAEGAPIAEVSSGDIFGFVANGLFFSDDSLYILAFDGGHHVVHHGTPPFGMDITVPTIQLTGLFGLQDATITNLVAHPTREYVARNHSVSLGLGGANAENRVMTWFGEFAQTAMTGEHGIHMDFNQPGTVLLTVEDGRDPYGGASQILKMGTWEQDFGSPQEWFDIRLRPFH